MSFQTIINILDLYGFKPQLFIGGFQRSGSLLGLISTILSIIMGLSISIYFFLKLFNTDEFTVITSEITPEGIESLELSNNTFYFNFALEDPISYKPFIDETIYYPKVYYKFAQRDVEQGFIWTEKILDFGPCVLNDFGTNYHKFFIHHNLSNYYCIKNLNESIKGVFQKNEYSFIFVELFECKNSSEKNNCKSQREIDYYLDGTFISIEYQGLTIDPNNYSDPNLPTLSEYYTTISHNFFKEIHIYFKEILVQTDKGWIFPNIYTKQYSQYDHTEDMISLKSTQKGNFLEFSIKYADKIQRYMRTYTKAQTVISNIGGFIKFIQSCFWVISYIFVQNKIYQRIINKLFYYEDRKSNSHTKLIKFRRDIKKSILSLNTPFNKKKKDIIYRKRNMTEFNYSNSSIGKSLENHSLSSGKIMNKSNVSSNQIQKEKTISNTLLHKFSNYGRKKFKSLIKYSINDKIFSKKKDIIKNKEIYLNYCERFCIKFHRKHTSYIIKLYKKGIGLIEQKLDVICLIKDSFQLSLFKKMFYNHEHILIMDNIIKTELSREKYDKNLHSLENNQKINNEIYKACQVIIKRYKNNLNNIYRTDMDNIDYYFVQLLNDQFNIEN